MNSRRHLQGRVLSQLLLACATLNSLAEARHPFEQVRLANGRRGDFLPLVELNTLMGAKSVSQLSTKFAIHNRWCQAKVIEFEDRTDPFDRQRLRDCRLSTSGPIVIAIPGYLTDDHVKWTEDVADEWARMDGNASVVTVSWKTGNRFIYSSAVANTPLIARQITIFLSYLAEATGSTLAGSSFVDRLQLVGHSLGAHIAGYVGQDLEGRVGRIVGLDPAGPSFDLMSPDCRLSKDDAKLVQVIHTNAGKIKYRNAVAGATVRAIDMVAQNLPLIGRARDALACDFRGDCDTAWYGIDLQLGHLDYYANGGRKQPGCEGIMHICDHGRAFEIYVSLLRRQREFGQQLGFEEALKFPPMSFYADSYEQFLNEGSVQTRCSLDGHQLSNSCAAPLDLFSPPEAILALSPRVERLFFQTNDGQPLMGDQYLLQIELDREISWDQGCALKVESSVGGSMQRVEINKKLRVARGADTPTLAIPFVSRQSFLWAKTIEGDDVNSKAQLRSQLPANIVLTIAGAKPTGLVEATRVKATKLLGWITRTGIGSTVSDRCQLIMKSLRVRPLVGGSGKTIVAIYGSRHSRLTTLKPGEHQVSPLEDVTIY